MFIISKFTGISDKKETCLPNKEYFIDYGCKRTNMIGKCNIFMSITLHLIGISKKQMIVKQGIISDHRYQNEVHQWMQIFA